MAGTTPQAPVREPVKCARPGCRNTFIPKHKRHRYCSSMCKGRCQAYRFALGNGQTVRR